MLEILFLLLLDFAWVSAGIWVITFLLMFFGVFIDFTLGLCIGVWLILKVIKLIL